MSINLLKNIMYMKRSEKNYKNSFNHEIDKCIEEHDLKKNICGIMYMEYLTMTCNIKDVRIHTDLGLNYIELINQIITKDHGYMIKSFSSFARSNDNEASEDEDEV